jgi:hypothetical protein
VSALENLILPDRCLAVFVDDTGHEALVPGQPVLWWAAILFALWQPWKRGPWSGWATRPSAPVLHGARAELWRCNTAIAAARW